MASDHAALQRDYTQLVEAFGGPSQSHPFLGHFKHLFTITSTHLYEAGAVVVAYGALEATEMVGLWFGRRWAEYLTFLATVILIPFEVYELTSSVSTLKLVTFVINVVIAAYLLWSKRLFGLNGGQQAEAERLRSAVSWESLENSLPGAPPASSCRRRRRVSGLVRDQITFRSHSGNLGARPPTLTGIVMKMLLTAARPNIEGWTQVGELGLGPAALGADRIGT